MKILVISYDFLPDNTPNTYRWANVLDEWAKLGLEIYVISSQKKGFSKIEKFNNYTIFRTREWLVGSFKNSFNENSFPASPKHYSISHFIKKGIKYVYNNSIKLLYWPDFAFLWIFPTFFKAKELIEKHNIDRVITVSWPFSSHLVGYLLKKEFTNLHWLIDSIDPFNFFEGVNNRFLFRKLNYIFEGKVFSLSNHVTVTTNRIRNEYIKLYPELENKISVVGNLFVAPLFLKSTNHIVVSETNSLKLVFIGSLIENVRIPQLCLDFFVKLVSLPKYSSAQLYFYGPTNNTNSYFDLYNEFIGRNIFIMGIISREEVRDVIANSSILINIGNLNQFQEPSKLFEYIYYQKPIINFKYIENDTSEQVLNFYPKKINLSKEKIDNFSFIHEFENLLLIRDHKISFNLINSILEPHMIGFIQNAFFHNLSLN